MFGSYDKAIEVIKKLDLESWLERECGCLHGVGPFSSFCSPEFMAEVLKKYLVSALKEAKTDEIKEYEQHCEGAGKVPETDNDYDVLKDGDPY